MATDEIWFRRKTYGWGWTPANGKGWLTILIHTLSIIIYPYWSLHSGHRPSIFLVILIAVISSAFLIILCVLKGEKPGWRWGNKF